MKQAEKPLLVLFKGYPGTGKSYLAKQLSSRMNLPLIVRDKYKTLLYKHNYNDHIGEKSYDIMWRMARACLQSSKGCICDTSLIQPIDSKKIDFFLQEIKANLLIIECYCINEKEHKKRLQKRKLYPSYYSVNSYIVYKKFANENSKYKNYLPPYKTIQIDTSQNISIDSFIQYLYQIVESENNTIFKYNLK